VLFANLRLLATILLAAWFVGRLLVFLRARAALTGLDFLTHHFTSVIQTGDMPNATCVLVQTAG
jgi:hypothetical protein